MEITDSIILGLDLLSYNLDSSKHHYTSKLKELKEINTLLNKIVFKVIEEKDYIVVVIDRNHTNTKLYEHLTIDIIKLCLLKKATIEAVNRYIKLFLDYIRVPNTPPIYIRSAENIANIDISIKIHHQH